MAFATQLSKDSDVYYFRPQEYEAVKLLWKLKPRQCWPAFTSSDQLHYVVGVYEHEQPVGKFYDENADLEALRGSHLAWGCYVPNLVDIFQFAQDIQPCIDERPGLMNAALDDAIRYHDLHRRIVTRVGRLLNIDMADHDLTKTRIVQAALAYVHHWYDEHDEHLLQSAKQAIKAGHTECEDHHPEYEEVQFGKVNVQKLLVDRLSVHLQKDVVDAEYGWQVDLKWIPKRYLKDWEDFKQKHKHINLYTEVLYRVKDEAAKSYLKKNQK